MLARRGDEEDHPLPRRGLPLRGRGPARGPPTERYRSCAGARNRRRCETCIRGRPPNCLSAQATHRRRSSFKADRVPPYQKRQNAMGKNASRNGSLLKSVGDHARAGTPVPSRANVDHWASQRSCAGVESHPFHLRGALRPASVASQVRSIHPGDHPATPSMPPQNSKVNDYYANL
jgi:hypothetical protein